MENQAERDVEVEGEEKEKVRVPWWRRFWEAFWGLMSRVINRLKGLRLKQYIVIVLILAVVVAGVVLYLTVPRVTFKGYEILDHKGKPMMRVYFETNIYPVTVRLLSEEKEVMDSVEVQVPEDIPVLLDLRPSPYTLNVVPGVYYIRFLYYESYIKPPKGSAEREGGDKRAFPRNL